MWGVLAWVVFWVFGVGIRGEFGFFFCVVRESAFGGFSGFVCCFGCCVVSDFLGFWIFWALSQCAVRGLYGVASN